MNAPQLHVPATAAAQERHPVVLKHGDAFAVFDDRGDIAGACTSAEGLFCGGTRLVSSYELRLAGRRPLLLSSTTQESNAVFDADLTNSDFVEGDRVVLVRESIAINRKRFVWEGALYERLLIRNFDTRPFALEFSLAFGADFADVFEVRGQQRAERGTATIQAESARRAVATYRALDDVRVRAEFAFDPAPDVLDGAAAHYRFALERGTSRRVFVRIGTYDESAQPFDARTFYRDLRASRRDVRTASAAAAAVSSANPIFDEIVRRSVADTYMLVTRTPSGPYPYAGVPWYSTPFGRDGIITAWMMLWADPSLARGVLRFLAATQARELDPARDAEPGKILHEMRDGEMARLGEVPFGRYYGTVDATPLFVVLLGAYVERTGDLELARELWPNALAALDWMRTYGDLDGDGFIEYARKSSDGLANQGWKDSQDAVFHADGALAEGPIALCEVQSYAYGAMTAAATVAERLGDESTALELRIRADALRVHFEERFWCEELSTYALALDGEKRQCRVRTSNAGHALLCGIASPERARRVAATLLSSASFSGWGIRTVAMDAPRYNPLSYHNGSVWPHDNGLIALGFARYALKDAVLRVATGLFDAASALSLNRLPELFCGFERRRRPEPTSYPVACAPQAWSSATVFALLQASLGVALDVSGRTIRFDRPVLPPMVDGLFVRRLRLGDASADVRLRRSGTTVAVVVERRHGDVAVEIAC